MKALLRRDLSVLEPSISCSRCGDTVDEFTAIKDNWRYWSDATTLHAYCAECSKRELEQHKRGNLDPAGALRNG